MPQNITQRMCEKSVEKQTKHYDKEVPGLYVQITKTCPATFYFRIKCDGHKGRKPYRLGLYHRELFTIDMARNEALLLKVRASRGEDIFQSRRTATEQRAKQAGMTMDKLIDLRIEWAEGEDRVISHTEEGSTIKMKKRMRDAANVASHLNRFVRPRLGKMIARDVTRGDIAQLQKDILAGTLIMGNGKRSKEGSASSARHMRKAVSGLFKWAAQYDYVETSPCVNLPSLPKEEPRKRRLSHDEIRTLWHGLDRDDIAVDRKICLAIKFTLATMLRSWEALGIHRDELRGHDLNSAFPQVDIPAERVKKDRVIHQPLSDLAVEIAKESLGNYTYLFAGRFGTEPLNRKAMACALRGKVKRVKGQRVVVSRGLCDQLGIKPFSPHDLRRTASSLLAGLKVPQATISILLDHQAKVDDKGHAIPAVTGKHYDHDPRIAEKREALQLLADEIRRIVGEPARAAESCQRMAA